MDNLPQNAEQVEIEGTTVPFYKYEKNGAVYIQFNSSKTGHPEPFINAMSGLESLQDGEKLVMINSKPPMGLFPKIENDFEYEIELLEDDNTQVIFTKKSKDSVQTDFKDTNCKGESCSNK